MERKGKTKKKRGMPLLLIKTLGLVLAAICLCHIFALVTFSFLGLDAFADIQKKEMHSRTQYIAEVTSSYLENKISLERYRYILGKNKNIWNAAVYAYSTDKKMIMSNSDGDIENDNRIISKYLDRVLSGQTVQDMDVIIIGVPIMSSFNNVIGAAFMVKPVQELNAAMKSVKNALSISLILSFIAMLCPVYIVSYFGIAQPIQEMTEVAQKMAEGDYTTVEVHGRGEIASLGKSLNVLSHSLDTTIGDLQSERNMLREILNGMEDGVLAFDLNNRVIQHNPAALKFLNTNNNNISDSNIMRTIIDHIIAMDKNSDEPIEFNTQSGERILHVRMNLVKRTNSDGYIVVLLHDITEAARYEQSRKDYVANVSHELRTPIANIKDISELLCDGIIAQDKLQKYYEHLYKESDRLSRLINDLLELSRMQSGKFSIEKRKTDLYEIVMEVADRFSSAAREHNKQIVPVCPDNISYAMTNEDRIEQVLIILIDNAIKHSESETITVRVEEDVTHFTVSVENSGSIDEADLPHLFERFYKADKAHSGEGSGLGLSIASEIMNLLDEKLWVTSQNGIVTFAFTLAKYSDM